MRDGIRISFGMFNTVADKVAKHFELAKAARHTIDDGTPVHSFSILLAEFATIVRNTCLTPQSGSDAPTFEVLTTPGPKQQRALQPGGRYAADVRSDRSLARDCNRAYQVLSNSGMSLERSEIDDAKRVDPL